LKISSLRRSNNSQLQKTKRLNDSLDSGSLTKRRLIDYSNLTNRDQKLSDKVHQVNAMENLFF